MTCTSKMKELDVKVDIFWSHSIRVPSTSKCKTAGFSFEEISKSTAWSSKQSFALFYDKSIEQNFSETIFEKCTYCIEMVLNYESIVIRVLKHIYLMVSCLKQNFFQRSYSRLPIYMKD